MLASLDQETCVRLGAGGENEACDNELLERATEDALDQCPVQDFSLEFLDGLEQCPQTADLLEMSLLVGELLVGGAYKKRPDRLAQVRRLMCERCVKCVVGLADLDDIPLADAGLAMLTAGHDARLGGGSDGPREPDAIRRPCFLRPQTHRRVRERDQQVAWAVAMNSLQKVRVAVSGHLLALSCRATPS